MLIFRIFDEIIPKNRLMRKSILFTLFIVFLLSGDLTYSFLQYYHSPLYGDLEGGILPNEDVQKIIDDPFGVQMLKTGEKHINPNRFFSHFFFMKYLQGFPLFLQNFVKPIQSVYLSSAIFKIIVQFLFIYFLSVFITGEGNVFNKKFLIGAILITPLFQTYGYNGNMGIIDKSIAYSFFYALPIVLSIFFYYLFYEAFCKKRNRLIRSILMFPLCIILPLSGPLVPGIILITSALVIIRLLFIENKSGFINSLIYYLKKVPKLIILLFILMNVMSLYSLFLGLYDSNYIADSVSIFERYIRLPLGLFDVLTQSLGFPLVLIAIGINSYVIKKQLGSADYQRHIKVLKWIGIFAIAYLLLLPLGGYRPYRENTIRYDTFIPVTICIIYFWGITSFTLLQKLKGLKLRDYIIGLSVLLLIYTFEDTSNLNENNCEKEALEYIANSPNDIVKVPTDCNIISWNKMTDYKKSDSKAELLMMWKITDEKKLFYQEVIE